jgi:hypothetical protein
MYRFTASLEKFRFHYPSYSHVMTQVVIPSAQRLGECSRERMAFEAVHARATNERVRVNSVSRDETMYEIIRTKVPTVSGDLPGRQLSMRLI